MLAGLLVVVGLTVVFARSAAAAAWVLVAVFAATEAIVPPLELQATLGALTVYGLDLVTAPLFAIGLVRLLTRPNPRAMSLPLLALSALFGIHVFSGMALFGIQAAVTAGRPWLYLLGPLLYASQAVPTWRRESFVPLLAGGAALAVFGLVHFAQYGVHAANTYIDVRGEFLDARPVASQGTILIIQCLLIAFSARFVRSPLWWIAVASMGCAVILLQHRTVWIVAALTGVVAYVRWARAAVFVNQRAALTAMSAILFVAPVALFFTVTSTAFAESVESSTGRGSTLAWRTESWEALIGEHHATENLLVGVPAGTSLEREVNDTVVTQSPHSVYVDSYLSFGLLGPLIVVWLWLLIVRHRRRASAALGISGVVIVLLVVSQALYGITNMLAPIEGLLIGMLLQAAYFSERRGAQSSAGTDRREPLSAAAQ